MVTHGLVEGSGGFPGQTDDGIAVGAIVGDFEIHHGIVIADDQVDILAHGAGLVIENPDAVGIGAGQVVLGQAQLGEGAEHAVGLLAPELALGDMHAAGQPGVVQGGGDQIALVHVLSAGDDLYGLLLAHIHLADPHVIGVGMADHGKNLAHDHVFDLGVHAFVGLHLLAENGQCFDEFFIGNVAEIHEFFVQPFSVQLHCLSLLRTGSGTARRCRRSTAGH